MKHRISKALKSETGLLGVKPIKTDISDNESVLSIDEELPNTPELARGKQVSPDIKKGVLKKTIKKEPKEPKVKKVIVNKYDEEHPPERGIRVPRHELKVNKIHSISYPELLNESKHGHHRKKHYVVIDYVDQYGINRKCNIKFGEEKRKPNLKFKPNIEENILDPKFWYYNWYAVDGDERGKVYTEIRQKYGL